MCIQFFSVIGLVLVALVIVVLHGHGFLHGQKMGMMMRVMTQSAIHKKVLYNNYHTQSNTNIGSLDCHIILCHRMAVWV